jgi:putative ABC transport system permease protein
MPWRWLENLRELLTRERRDDDLERELRSHLDEETEEQIESGVSQEEAPYAARRAFGNVTRVEERTRESWRGEGVSAVVREFAGGVVQDARYGLKGLIKQPTFTIAAVLALGLGIGATTTIFSVIQNVLLDPYPMYRNVDRMVGIEIHDDASSRPGGRDFLQTAEFLDYQEQMTSFDAVIAGGGDGSALYAGPHGVEQLNGAYLSGNTFEVLGIGALIGRTITSEDGKPGAPAVFVISYKLWANRFGLDRSLIGQTFTLDGVPTTLIGVMPPRVSKLGADVWRPIALDRANKALQNQFFKFQGRLKPGVTLEQADAEFRTVAERIAKAYPKNYPQRFSVHVREFVDSVVGAFRKTLYMMAAAVALLLLIACANVANMLLSRAAGRQRELALRTSLGASRGRLVRQLLIESLMLALAGMAVGCAFAQLGIKALVGLIPEGLIPRESLIQLDTRVLLFSLIVSGVTALLFGLVPAFQSVRRDLMNPLREAGKGIGGGYRGGWLSSALVICEIALSLVLLTSAGVLMRSVIKLQTTDLGFEPANILLVAVPIGRGDYKTAAEQTRFVAQTVERIRTSPGIVNAAATTGFPPFGSQVADFDVSGVGHQDRWSARLELIGDGYFRTMGVPMVQGRDFTADDVHDARRMAILNQRFVERFLPTIDPIGRTVTFTLRNDQGRDEERGYEIVGVVRNIKNAGVNNPIEPELFAPVSAGPMRWQTIMVRTVGPPTDAVRTIKSAIWAVDPLMPVAEADALEQYLMRFAYAAPRLGLYVFSAFAGIGLVLVVIGVYSLIAYTVSRQTREIGIRIAVGAARSDVLRMTLGLGVRWLTIGTTLGLAASFAATRLLASELYDVSPSDPLTFAAVVAVIGVAGFCASYFPALRATRVDPIVVLRYE